YYLWYLVNYTWSQIVAKGTIPKARYNHCSVAIGNNVYIVGGQAPMGRFSDIYCFDVGKCYYTVLFLYFFIYFIYFFIFNFVFFFFNYICLYLLIFNYFF